ncbi:MAG: AAA family ATPase [Phycisphaerales bacterium]
MRVNVTRSGDQTPPLARVSIPAPTHPGSGGAGNETAASGDAQESIPAPTNPAPGGAGIAFTLTALGELGPSASPDWIWPGYIARGGVTLLTGLWKAGKTTLLGHLLRDLPLGTGLVDVPMADPVAIVSEEPAQVWARRRDALDLGSSILLLQRESFARPSHQQWVDLIDRLTDAVRERSLAMVVFDTLPSLWPVHNENDASEVVHALAPLRNINNAGAGVLLIHHPRKGEGDQAQASRGSGALPGFVDAIVELRRFNPQDPGDTRRKLTGYGRYAEVPPEMVIDLTPQGYRVLGQPGTVHAQGMQAIIEGLLPSEPPGMTVEQVLERWPEATRPGLRHLRNVLNQGAEDERWERRGRGVRHEPHEYLRMA